MDFITFFANKIRNSRPESYYLAKRKVFEEAIVAFSPEAKVRFILHPHVRGRRLIIMTYRGHEIYEEYSEDGYDLPENVKLDGFIPVGHDLEAPRQYGEELSKRIFKQLKDAIEREDCHGI